MHEPSSPSRSLRVLFVHAANSGLPPEYRVHRTLAEHATSAGVQSRFVWQSSANQAPLQSEQISYYDFGRDFSIQPKPSRLRRAAMMYGQLPGGVTHILSNVRRFQPHLVYTSQQTHDIDLARIVARLTRLPHLIHLHYSVGPWLGKGTLSKINKSQGLLAVSEFIRQTALLQGYPAARVHTVPNALELEPRADADALERPRVRAEFGWSPETPLLLCAGRLDPGKGQAALIDAFAAVHQRLPEARLLLCGRSSTRDDYGETLRRRVRDLGLTECIHFAGHRDDVARLMRAADAFCLPTEMEPFGLVFLEAMAAGLACVAYFSGAVPEIVLHETTGLLCYPGDAEGLARNVLRVLQDRELARRLGEHGRARAERDFAPTTLAASWAAELRRYLETARA